MIVNDILERMRGEEQKVIKSSIWYIICTFITNAISFVTAPIFARILSKQIYGEYSNFASWYAIISCFTTLNLHATIMRAKYDFDKDFPTYVSSILVLGTVNTAICYLLMLIFHRTLVNTLNLSLVYINIIFICQMFQPASVVFQTIQRLNYRYKLSVFITIITAVSTSLGGILLVYGMEDKLLGRVLGAQLPVLIVNIILYVNMMKKGRGINLSHWKYAYFICLPYIPHLLAGNLLNALDRIMITDIRGAEENAIYSVAGNGAMILSIFSLSVNNAVQPWIFEKIHANEPQQVKKTVSVVLWLYAILSIYLILFAREVVLVLGGEKYLMSAFVLPPLILGALFQFMYTFYVSVEQFEKKTVGMAVATIIAAGANFVLNAIFIPKFGYVASGLTTAASYLLLLLFHFFLVKRMGFTHFFQTRLLFILPAIIIVCSVVVSMLNDLERYLVITTMTLLLGITFLGLYKKKNRGE